MMLRKLLLLFLLAATPAFAASEGGAIPVPLPLFPANNWWNTDISAAPVDPSSASYIAFIGATVGLHPDFGGDAGGGNVYGFPFIQVDSSQPLKTVNFVGSPSESDGVGVPFYPIPDQAITSTGWIEGGPPGNVDLRSSQDRHMLIVNTQANTLYELYNVYYDGTQWNAGSGAFFDMKTNNRRPDGWTSADAAGLAMLPGLVRYDEVYGPNEIGHAFRVTVRATNGYVFPASHNAGSTTGALPMGARLRLKASTDISGFPADAQKIFRAFKKYGLIVADNGTDMYVSGTYDTRWDNSVLNPAFGGLTANDFEVVQLGWKPAASFVLALPQTMGAGDATDGTVTVYDSNYNVDTGYRGTIHFASTDGSATLPVDYAFTAADAGAHTFSGGFTMRTAGGQTIYGTDVSDATITTERNVIVGPPAPAGLTATASSITNVNLTWNPSSGAVQYEVWRASAGSPYALLTTTVTTSLADNPVSPNATYVYEVRAIDSSMRDSPFSIPDAATTMFFTDDPLTATVTTIKAVHITELRTAINLMRAAAGLTAATFTDPSLSGLPVKAIHLQELRTALAQARAALGLPAIAFTDSSLTAGTTIVKAVHIQELRSGVE